MSDYTTDPTAPQYPSEMEPAELAAWVASEVQKDWQAAGDWRDEAREAFDIVDGRQWAETDQAYLKDTGRVPITFNRVAPMIDAVCGAQVNNRNEIRFFPRSGDDGGKAELLNGVARWVMDQTDAEDQDSSAFRDAAIGGMGWVELRMDYEDDPEGKIVSEKCDPFEMGWDRRARAANLTDANQVHRRQRYSKDAAQAAWPEFTFGGLGDDVAQTGGVHVTAAPGKDQYAEDDDGGTRDDDEVTITHFQWCERRTVWRVLNEATQTIETINAEQWEALGEKLGEEVRDRLPNVKMPQKKWWRVYECGGEIAQLGECPDPKGSTFKCITGRWDRRRRVFYGLVRAVRDPQMWANKWLSQSLHIINTNAKSGWIFEDGAIEDERKFEENIAKAGSNVKVAAGALAGGRIRQKEAPPFPQAFDRLLQLAIGSMPDVTGINRELLGTVDREQAGILEAQRKQASQAVLAPLFDSLRRYHKEQGRLLALFIQKYIPPDKVIRITMPDGEPRDVAMMMIPDAATYDVVVDQAPTSPNQKSEVWQALQPMLPVLVKEVPAPIMLKLLKFSPLPESVVAELEKDMKAMAAQPKPPDPAVVKAQADIEATKVKTQADIQLKTADLQSKQMLAAQELQQKREEFQMDMAFKRMEAEQDMRLAEMKAQQQARFAEQDAERNERIEVRKADIAASASVEKMKGEKDVLAEPVREVMEPVRDLMTQMAELLVSMRQQGAEDHRNSMAMMSELQRLIAAEREVIRGSDGKMAGVRIKPGLMN